jgi:hypothetical protein
MGLPPPLLRTELASFGRAGIPGSDEPKQTGFVARSQKDRKVPTAQSLARHPVISSSLTINYRLPKDDLVYLLSPVWSPRSG